MSTDGFATAAQGLVCTWGAFVFALFLVQSGRRAPAPDAPVRGGALWTLYALACLALYLHPLASDLIALRGGDAGGRLRDAAAVAVLCAVFLLPALLAHLFLRIDAAHLPRPRGFAVAVGALWALCGGLLALWVTAGLRLGWTAEPHLEPVPALTAASSALVLTMELVARARDPSPALRRPRAVYAGLAAASIATAGLAAPGLPAEVRAAAGLAGLTLPVLFVLSTAYLHPRAAMFDRLVKWGLFSLAAVTALWAVCALAWPGSAAGRGGWIAPAAAFPLVLLAPWAHRGISSIVDRRWLGRARSPAQAQRAFLSALAAAEGEPELVRVAESCLSELFPAAAGAPRAARVELGPGAAAEPRVRAGAFEAPVLSGGRAAGSMRIQTPAGDRPFLSEDRELFASLGQALGMALDNVRLRERRVDQERRERELTALADRAELRALRARVDPHFLFNALNAVAALVRRDPARAEAVVERLAEVFRYTLRRSEREWVRVEDELEFVRAYLEVEQARFGDRLAVEYRISERAAVAYAPAMVLSVLVENAVKHGVGRVRGPARLRVAAEEDGGRVRLRVEDSGPGLGAGEGAPAGEGHGLRNVRARLRGWFGGHASLDVGRDAERGLTVAEVTLPRLEAPPAAEGTLP